ncbi:TonB-dependent receptor domain-containing protein [Caulobacter segnis]
MASKAALAYVLGTPYRDQHFQQDVAAFNLRTNDNPGLGGADLSGDRRGIPPREDAAASSRPSTRAAAGSTAASALPAASTTWPRPMSKPWSRCSKAPTSTARPASPTTAPPARVKTWKAGVTYAPIPDIKLRGSASRDIRAANMSELYDAGTARSNSANINGVSTPLRAEPAGQSGRQARDRR